MTATRSDVDHWIENAKSNGFKYIISVCDTFDYLDFPVYCLDESQLKIEHSAYNGVNMQKVNEIIRINANSTVDENLHISEIL